MSVKHISPFKNRQVKLLQSKDEYVFTLDFVWMQVDVSTLSHHGHKV